MAMACPMPRVPPVTIAVFPLRENSDGIVDAMASVQSLHCKFHPVVRVLK